MPTAPLPCPIDSNEIRTYPCQSDLLGGITFSSHLQEKKPAPPAPCSASASTYNGSANQKLGHLLLLCCQTTRLCQHHANIMPTSTVSKPDRESWQRLEETEAETGHDAEEQKAKSNNAQCSMAHLQVQTVPGSSAPTSPLSPGGSGGLPPDSIEKTSNLNRCRRCMPCLVLIQTVQPFVATTCTRSLATRLHTRRTKALSASSAVFELWQELKESCHFETLHNQGQNLSEQVRLQRHPKAMSTCAPECVITHDPA